MKNMSASTVAYVQVRDTHRRNSLPTYEEATARVVNARNAAAIESRNDNSTARIGNAGTNEISTVIHYYRSDYTDDTPTVIRYYASDYASGCVLDAPAVIKYYKSDYVAPNDYVMQTGRRQQHQEPSSKNWSHEADKQHKIKPTKLSRVAATASTLQSFKNKVLKIPYLRMK